MAGKHPSHVTRFSFDASTYDEICVNCGETDQVPGGWGKLAEPCPVPPEQRRTVEEYHDDMRKKSDDKEPECSDES